jgi:hypothetical protein
VYNSFNLSSRRFPAASHPILVSTEIKPVIRYKRAAKRIAPNPANRLDN